MRRVRENKDVMAALDFARYVTWSGIIKVLDANASESPLVVDGALIRWKCEELTRMCQERFRTGQSSPHVEQSELEAINRKLDLIAGHVAQFVPAVPTLKVEPCFQVIAGGLDTETVSVPPESVVAEPHHQELRQAPEAKTA